MSSSPGQGGPPSEHKECSEPRVKEFLVDLVVHVLSKTSLLPVCPPLPGTQGGIEGSKCEARETLQGRRYHRVKAD